MKKSAIRLQILGVFEILLLKPTFREEAVER